MREILFRGKQTNNGEWTITINELKDITNKNIDKLFNKACRNINKKLKRAAKQGLVSIQVHTKRNNYIISSGLASMVVEHYINLGYNARYDAYINRILICWEDEAMRRKSLEKYTSVDGLPKAEE